jgi:hypothetical protein
MRDFRDAKVMAHALREALKAKAVETTHSESLELIAKAFGYENWNVLSAKIDAAKPRQSAESTHSSAKGQDAARKETLYCSFCGKSQHDVRKLIAGPAVYICDECVDICLDFVEDLKDEDLIRLMQGDEGSARNMSTEELAHYIERGRIGVERNRLALDAIARKLAMRKGETPRTDDLLASPRFYYLKNKTRDDLIPLQQSAQQQLKRYEEAVRIAATVLGERRQ